MRPMLVSKIMDISGQPIQTDQPQLLSTPISRQTAVAVRQAMYGVVRCGSGSLVPELLNSNMSIIGKTSTGQVSDTGNLGANGWMITQAPYTVTNSAQMPALTIVAMKQNGGDGGASVGPMIAAMYHDIYTSGYVKTRLPGPPNPSYCCSTQLLQCS